MASFKCRLFEILNCYHKGETVGAGTNNNVYKNTNNRVAWILQKLLNKKFKKIEKGAFKIRTKFTNQGKQRRTEMTYIKKKALEKVLT